MWFYSALLYWNFTLLGSLKGYGGIQFDIGENQSIVVLHISIVVCSSNTVCRLMPN
jgi:hypothetical protein